MTLSAPSFHPCRLGPVVRHVGQYLAGPDAPEAEQRHAAADAFRRGQADYEQFREGMREGTELVVVELSIRGPDHDLLSVSTHLPGPLTLLLVCLRNCADGDLVGVRQRTAKCGSRFEESAWPFGLDVAERLTRPVAALFADLADAGPESVRRREQTIRGRTVVAELRREQRGGRDTPRVLLWRDDQQRGAEVRLGRRVVRLGLDTRQDRG